MSSSSRVIPTRTIEHYDLYRWDMRPTLRPMRSRSSLTIGSPLSVSLAPDSLHGTLRLRNTEQIAIGMEDCDEQVQAYSRTRSKLGRSCISTPYSARASKTSYSPGT